MSLKTKRIDRPFEIKEFHESKDVFTFVGYGSVFGEIDSYNDVVVKGAFNTSLAKHKTKNRKVVMLHQHQANNPIGVYSVVKEDDTGLYVEGEINLKVQQGREDAALMEQGALTGLSIGYNTVNAKYDPESDLLFLTEVDLWEISPVTFPAGDTARVNSIKAIESADSIRDVESILRDAGFSKTEAQALISKARGFVPRSESVVISKQTADTIKSAIHSILGK